MNDFSHTINLRCTFCRSNEFALPCEGYTPYAGSFVVCANCGRENDVTSLLIVAKAMGIDIATCFAEKLMSDMKKRIKKNFESSKYIKFR
jgi:hypothetical protein